MKASFAALRRGLSAAAIGLLFPAMLTAAEPAIGYNRDIRPILADKCFRCHGPDSAARKADLRLDKRDVAIDAGALVPGKPAESEMIARILSDDPDTLMPPPASHKTLDAKQKDLLKRWIASGAQYEPHWSLIPPQKPELPAVKNGAWIRNPIDRFILARLEVEGLSPAPEADVRTLARRVSLDLTGLPPEPAMVEAFVNDKSPDAYEKYIDQLLESPRWGEHRGRYWLDVARYADTHGIHFDNFREIHAYRDWVIEAFNRNLPFDQFTVEQLAGDLLPNPTLEQRIATGFHRCNITTNEGGIIDEEYKVLYARDRTETTSLVWLGLTAGCAVCHDHKFDPLTQREFYSLSAFFNNTTQPVRDGNKPDTPPILQVPKLEDRSRFNELRGLIAAAKQKVEARKQAAQDDFDKWLGTVKPQELAALVPTSQLQLHAPFAEGDGQTLSLTVADQTRELTLASGIAWETAENAEPGLRITAGDTIVIPDAGNFKTGDSFSYGAWIKLSGNVGGGAVIARMDNEHDYRGWDLWIENNRVGCHIIHKWPDNALKMVSKQPIKAGQWTHVFVTYNGSAKPSGVKIYVNGKPQPFNIANNSLKETIQTEVPLKIAQRNTTQRINNLVLRDVRLYSRELPEAEVRSLGQMQRIAALVTKEKRNAKEQQELFDWWLAALDQPYRELSEAVSKLESEQQAIEARGTIAHVMNERNGPATAYVLYRGEYDQRRDEVRPATPAILPPYPADAPRNRLGLARWLLQPNQPLTARVTVNRFWQQVFGQGIVRTTGDFGVAGELPSHPELLDWLAVDFREHGWDIKRFFKQIVMSATYRQAAQVTPEKLEKDPDNRLLARGPRFRMDAEMIRDNALAVSGLLSARIGGPSVKPYQPPGVWEAVAMIGSNTRNYKQDSGEALYRRSMYTFWKRSAPPASMDVFNAPSREFCVVRRERTDTPLQALATLNDEQHVEAARNLAQHAIQAGGDFDQRLAFISLRLISRRFDATETAVIKKSFEKLNAYYQAHADDAAKVTAVGESKPDPKLDARELAAWTMLANELLNLDEVLNK